MLERKNIQTRGFHNLVNEAGEVTGFQLCFRSTYYKGVWLSQVRVGDVVVDGETFGRDQQIWEINGVEYTPEEMEKLGNTHWHILDVATIKVKKPGGLAQGYHDVEVNFGTVSSYGPVRSLPDPKTDEELTIPFPIEVFALLETQKYTNRMIIV